MKEISPPVRSLEDAERRIARLSRDYAILRAINAAIVRIRDRDELFEEACRVVVLHGGFRMAWIGVIGASPADPIVVLAHAGDERDFLSRVRVILDRSVPGGRGVTAAAIAGNRSAVDNDIEGNRALGAIRDECLLRGYRSALALPLRADGNPIGALVIYAAEPGYFTREEVRLLEEFAADVMLGMAFISKSREAEYLAFHDPLTGLANRARFLQRVAAHAGADSHRSFAVMLLDLERFHSINDTYGPAVGDDVLRAVATRLCAACPADEPPARIGADAFGVLLAGPMAWRKRGGGSSGSSRTRSQRRSPSRIPACDSRRRRASRGIRTMALTRRPCSEARRRRARSRTTRRSPSCSTRAT